MKAHIITDGIVTNTIEVNSLDFMHNLIQATEGTIGWIYADGVLTAPIDIITDTEKSEIARTKRDNLLSNSDWTQVADAPVDQVAWATYRQALRDITTHANFPNLEEADWPVAP